MLCVDREPGVELRDISEVERFSEYPKRVPLVLVCVVSDCGIVALSALDAPASSFQPRIVVEVCAEQVLVLICQWSMGDVQAGYFTEGCPGTKVSARTGILVSDCSCSR